MKKTPISRRQFIAKSSLVPGAAVMSSAISKANHHGEKKLKMGWVGTGSRGNYDVRKCLEAEPNSELYAVADLFEDKVEKGLGRVRQERGEQVNVTPDRIFYGFDGYRRILEMEEIDIVFFTTPPGFRPQHFKECIEAGKHAYLEKPGAVDPVGVRSLIETTELAEKKNLSVTVGMQQRFMPQYVEIIKRLQDGAIGEITNVGAYWLGTMKNWHWKPRQPEWSDVEYQIRTWPHWTWLSGDCCVEQLVHNLDISNWVLGKLPTSCRGVGGRIVRNGPEYGNIYDHFSFDYDYEGGVKGLGMNAQIEGITNKVMNTFNGTKGTAWVSRGGGEIDGVEKYKYRGDKGGDMPLFTAMFEGIRKGEPMNQGKLLAEATMTGILGRIAAYTGRSLSWKWAMKGSKLDLTKEVTELGPLPADPHAIPGVTLPV